MRTEQTDLSLHHASYGLVSPRAPQRIRQHTSFIGFSSAFNTITPHGLNTMAFLRHSGFWTFFQNVRTGNHLPEHWCTAGLCAGPGPLHPLHRKCSPTYSSKTIVKFADYTTTHLQQQGHRLNPNDLMRNIPNQLPALIVAFNANHSFHRTDSIEHPAHTSIRYVSSLSCVPL